MTESGVLTPSAKSVLLGFAGGVSTLESLAPVTVSLRSRIAVCSAHPPAQFPSTQMPDGVGGEVARVEKLEPTRR
ncbi:LOW QUALITY PROTEIN: hypothetical protein GX50_03786 [[Emmonsia] crescens]|uniref:Uncharacterized protein n=1 Tax=[Emmonsia] crescens TaxID=73230 RepID=A0A2B7ZJR0_9EURO|nr:LOW QUALITY PROTEIN: hypothetical protein GX50_03786 [Emmonsia crescens]